MDDDTKVLLIHSVIGFLSAFDPSRRVDMAFLSHHLLLLLLKNRLKKSDIKMDFINEDVDFASIMSSISAFYTAQSIGASTHFFINR
jgi:hypothetical protein